MNKQDSIRKQEKCGTLERNQAIRAEYRYGLGTLLAKKHGITRQMIHIIINESDLSDLSRASQDAKISPFRKFYDGFLKKLFNRGV